MARRLWLGIALFASSAVAFGDTITIKTNGKTERLAVNYLAGERESKLLFEGPDTQRYLLDGKDLVRWDRSGGKLNLYSRTQLRAALLKEFPGFYIFETSHYLLVYNCDLELAQLAGRLLERAYHEFASTYRALGSFRFDSPRQALIAVAYRSQDEFKKARSAHAGGLMGDNVAGFYSTQSNRIYLFDTFNGRFGEFRTVLAKREGEAAVKSALVPFVEQNVAKIVHEAVHQLAYNLGFHERNTAVPKWFVEGMALYFETPSLEANPDGWTGAGQPNDEQLRQLARYFPNRPKGSLRTLLLDDERFDKPATALDAYAEAWAFTYFLVRMRTQGYVQYLRAIRGREAYTPYPPEERLRDFRTAFRKDPDGLDYDFCKFIGPMLPANRAGGR
jgi:hypothetical protein